MKRRKTRIPLFEFLRTGRFGDFTPRSDCTPEEVMQVLGKPSIVEVYGMGREGGPYVQGDARCFPVIVAYGSLEFHFDSPTNLFCVHEDVFVQGLPWGGPLKLVDSALLRFDRTLPAFLSLAEKKGLRIDWVKANAIPGIWEAMTAGGVKLHFECEDMDEPGCTPTLRAFAWVGPCAPAAPR